jgi:hypothetical protein
MKMKSITADGKRKALSSSRAVSEIREAGLRGQASQQRPMNVMSTRPLPLLTQMSQSSSTSTLFPPGLTRILDTVIQQEIHSSLYTGQPTAPLTHQHIIHPTVPSSTQTMTEWESAMLQMDKPNQGSSGMQTIRPLPVTSSFGSNDQLVCIASHVLHQQHAFSFNRQMAERYRAMLETASFQSGNPQMTSNRNHLGVSSLCVSRMAPQSDLLLERGERAILRAAIGLSGVTLRLNTHVEHDFNILFR